MSNSRFLCGENPPIRWFSRFIPTSVKYITHTRSHGNDRRCRLCLSTGHHQYSSFVVNPSDVLPPLQTKALVRPQPGVKNDRRNCFERLGASVKVFRFLLGRQYPTADIRTR